MHSAPPSTFSCRVHDRPAADLDLVHSAPAPIFSRPRSTAATWAIAAASATGASDAPVAADAMAAEAAAPLAVPHRLMPTAATPVPPPGRGAGAAVGARGVRHGAVHGRVGGHAGHRVRLAGGLGLLRLAGEIGGSVGRRGPVSAAVGPQGLRGVRQVLRCRQSRRQPRRRRCC